MKIQLWVPLRIEIDRQELIGTDINSIVIPVRMFGVKMVSEETLVNYLNRNLMLANLSAIDGEILLDSPRPILVLTCFMVTTNLCTQPLIDFGPLAQRFITLPQ